MAHILDPFQHELARFPNFLWAVGQRFLEFQILFS
jgi:hypothetical protein